MRTLRGFHFSQDYYPFLSRSFLLISRNFSKRPSTQSIERENVIEWFNRKKKILPLYLERFEREFEKSNFKDYLDFRFPTEWFPIARAKRPRRIQCHVGPTNSGKTYAAIQRLKEATTGVYCAPLRLLAAEMYEKLNKEGRPCGLRTGELCKGPQDGPSEEWNNAARLSCTVEMLDPSREFEVAVIDEFQMMADEGRGWAFTQAFISMNAKEIYLCGEEAAVDLVQRIAKELGDEVEVIKYQRLSPLVVSEVPLGSISNLRAGDCVVAFSRPTILALKEEIEKDLKRNCAVVYGNLPIENRLVQAQKFNSREDDYSMMVATNAIGMGLNLNIQRIIFHGLSMRIPNDNRSVPISPSHVKQIAGRAGRFGMGHEYGVVTCLNESDMPYLRECMNMPNENYQRAGLIPINTMIDEINGRFPHATLPFILNTISKQGRFGENFFPCISNEQLMISFLLEDYPNLLLPDRITLSCAPVKLNDVKLLNTFMWFVQHFASGRQCLLRDLEFEVFKDTHTYLNMAESYFKSLDLYLWLSIRYPKTFTSVRQAMKKRERLNILITVLLKRLGKPTSRKLKRKIIKPTPLHYNDHDLQRDNNDLDLLLDLLSKSEISSSSNNDFKV